MYIYFFLCRNTLHPGMCILLTVILSVIGLHSPSDPNDKTKKLQVCKLSRRQGSYGKHTMGTNGLIAIAKTNSLADRRPEIGVPGHPGWSFATG
jgi:hypothetical protein